MTQPTVTLMLCGDVMTGRGIDQAFPHPSPPQLYERYVRSALDYVRLAEEANGPIARPIPYAHIWGDGLAMLDAEPPDLRIVNLETAVTRSRRIVLKGINYRMEPDNVGCLTAAGINCCVLANNHVLDWRRAGLEETLAVLHAADLKTAGAGHDAAEASAPAVFDLAGEGRVLVYGLACPSSGVPDDWAARKDRSGVNFLDYPCADSAEAIAARILRGRRPGDLMVVSIHWEGNWGYEVVADDRAFARRLIDLGAADIVHGHSSHHPKGIEVYRDRPILYGCGDLINDYEGIGGRESFRSDLCLMYFVEMAGGGGLAALRMAPFRMANFRLNTAADEEAEWLRRTMDRECARFGGGVTQDRDGLLRLHWEDGPPQGA